MPTLSKKPRQGNRETSKKTTPAAAEPTPPPPIKTPPKAGQEPPKAPDFAAVQTEIDALLKPLEGWQWAYENTGGEIITLKQLSDTVLGLSYKMAGLAYLLDKIFDETDFTMKSEPHQALQFAVNSLKDEEERVFSLCPDYSPDHEAGYVCFVHPEAAK